MRVEWKSCFRICVSAFLLYLAIYYWSGLTNLAGLALQAAFPLILGGVIAYVANILMSFYERKLSGNGRTWKKVRRPVCMTLAFATVIAAIVLLIRLIIPQLISCFAVLLDALPGAIEALYRWLDENFGVSAWLQGQNGELPGKEEIEALIRKFGGMLLNGFGGAMSAVVSVTSTLVGGVVTLFMSIIFAVYILLGKEKLGSQFDRLMVRVLGEARCEKIEAVMKVTDDCFHSYIVGQPLRGRHDASPPAVFADDRCTGGRLRIDSHRRRIYRRGGRCCDDFLRVACAGSDFPCIPRDPSAA